MIFEAAVCIDQFVINTVNVKSQFTLFSIANQHVKIKNMTMIFTLTLQQQKNSLISLKKDK